MEFGPSFDRSQPGYCAVKHSLSVVQTALIVTIILPWRNFVYNLINTQLALKASEHQNITMIKFNITCSQRTGPEVLLVLLCHF